MKVHCGCNAFHQDRFENVYRQGRMGLRANLSTVSPGTSRAHILIRLFIHSFVHIPCNCVIQFIVILLRIMYMYDSPVVNGGRSQI